MIIEPEEEEEERSTAVRARFSFGALFGPNQAVHSLLLSFDWTVHLPGGHRRRFGGGGRRLSSLLFLLLRRGGGGGFRQGHLPAVDGGEVVQGGDLEPPADGPGEDGPVVVVRQQGGGVVELAADLPGGEGDADSLASG